MNGKEKEKLKGKDRIETEKEKEKEETGLFKASLYLPSFVLDKFRLV